GLRAGWSQGLSDALSADKPPVERGRAVLQEALHVVYDSTDTELSFYASWQNKGLWLTGCALVLMVPLAGLFHSGVLFLVGGVAAQKAQATSTGPGSLKIITATLKDGKTMQDYGQVKLDASGGTPPYTWSITAGQLPQGLKMDASGAITGVPMTDGTFSVSVQ